MLDPFASLGIHLEPRLRPRTKDRGAVIDFLVVRIEGNGLITAPFEADLQQKRGDNP